MQNLVPSLRTQSREPAPTPPPYPRDTLFTLRGPYPGGGLLFDSRFDGRQIFWSSAEVFGFNCFAYDRTGEVIEAIGRSWVRPAGGSSGVLELGATVTLHNPGSSQLRPGEPATVIGFRLPFQGLVADLIVQVRGESGATGWLKPNELTAKAALPTQAGGAPRSLELLPPPRY